MREQIPTTVILADDHEFLRDGLKAMFKKLKGVKLLSEASNGRELLEAVEKLKPEIVITDIRMPVIDGIQATAIIKEKFPAIRVIAFSNYDEENLIADMINAGADGYLLKNASKKELTEAINNVLAGKAYYCDSTSRKILNYFNEHKPGISRKEKEIHFTKREKEVLKLVCKGMTNKEIGKALNISVRTVETHRQSIQDKTGMRSAVSIALFASRLGYL
jgi:two-component system, NarL family, response regulator NreC